MEIVVRVGEVELGGRLLASPVARAFGELLPVEIRMTRWGDEYYGTLSPPLGEHPGEQVEVLEVGDLAYWEVGDALCLFFGPTPVSRDTEPRAASPVHRLGNVQGDWSRVRPQGGRATVIVERKGEG